jgi:hypothetical protein
MEDGGFADSGEAHSRNTRPAIQVAQQGTAEKERQREEDGGADASAGAEASVSVASPVVGAESQERTPSINATPAATPSSSAVRLRAPLGALRLRERKALYADAPTPLVSTGVEPSRSGLLGGDENSVIGGVLTLNTRPSSPLYGHRRHGSQSDLDARLDTLAQSGDDEASDSGYERNMRSVHSVHGTILGASRQGRRAVNDAKLPVRNVLQPLKRRPEIETSLSSPNNASVAGAESVRLAFSVLGVTGSNSSPRSLSTSSVQPAWPSGAHPAALPPLQGAAKVLSHTLSQAPVTSAPVAPLPLSRPASQSRTNTRSEPHA